MAYATGGSAMMSAAGNPPETMAERAFLSRGKVTAITDGVVHFLPSGTNYELHLLAPNYSGTAGALAEGLIRVRGRKIWTVPSGGNFIAPIFGTPRTIQGRVRAVREKSIVVHAGTPIVVDLPASDAAFDLVNGAIAVGAMVNIMVMPGAAFEPAAKQAR